jgi:hypothetical protein
VVGAGEQLIVTGRVTVGPERRVGEAIVHEPALESAGFLGATAVGPVEAAGQKPLLVPLEPRADDTINAEAPPERHEVWLERGRGEHDPVAELTVPLQAADRVVAQPASFDLTCEPFPGCVESSGVHVGECGTDDLLEPIAVSVGEGAEHVAGIADGRKHGTEPDRPEEERHHAVARRQRPVDVECGDDGSGAGHGRTRLYTRSVSEQSPEIFDDLYLGLQAGGALRKQRRGEELTEQEQEALGHWQRLSVWRKGIAVGAFAFGTFGLGFTLGGLIFGRRRATR